MLGQVQLGTWELGGSGDDGVTLTVSGSAYVGVRASGGLDQAQVFMGRARCGVQAVGRLVQHLAMSGHGLTGAHAKVSGPTILVTIAGGAWAGLTAAGRLTILRELFGHVFAGIIARGVETQWSLASAQDEFCVVVEPDLVRAVSVVPEVPVGYITEILKPRAGVAFHVCTDPRA